MAEFKGKGSFTRFLALGQDLSQVSESVWSEGLAVGKFVKRDLEMEEKNSGLAMYGNELKDPSYKTALVGSFILVSLRIDTMTVDKTELTMRTNEIVEHIKTERETDFISASELLEIKEEIIGDMNWITKTKNVAVIVDKARNQVFLGTNSEAIRDDLVSMMDKCFNIKLTDGHGFGITALMAGDEKVTQVLGDVDTTFIEQPLEVHQEFEDGIEAKLGSAFLTTLFYWAGSVGEKFDISLMANDMIEMSGEHLGAKKVIIKGGVVNRARELKDALLGGKTVSKIKMTFGEPGIEEEVIYGVTLDKETMSLSQISLPKSNEQGSFNRSYANLQALSRVSEFIDMFFEAFLSARYENSDLWKTTRVNIYDYIENL